MKKDIALLLLRLTFGGLMLLNHGWDKLDHLLNGNPEEWADPIGLGAPVSLALTVFAEVVCAGLVAVGLFTRWANIPLIITMLVAIFIVHWADPFGDKEMAIIYLSAYSAIALLGPGQFSIDSLIGRNK